MKARIFLTGCILAGFGSLSIAQENDDMYFNSKDRVKLDASKASKAADSYAYNTKKRQVQEFQSPNPTDSYSARNINPEYASRQNAKVAQQDEQDYFVSNYNYQSGAQYSNWYNSYSSWNNNPWYNMPACLPSYGYNGYGSPYGMGGMGGYGNMGGYYGYSNPWGNPYYYDSFYGGGYGGGSYGYYSGNSWGYGMNAYRPFGSGWGMGGGIGWAYNYGRPQNVIVVNNYGNAETRQVSYGKRSGRDNNTTYASNSSPQTRTATQSRSRNDVPASQNTTRTVTRTSSPSLTTQPRQEDYYNRSYRNSQQTAPSRTSNSSWGGNSNGRSSNTNTNSSWSPPANNNNSSSPSSTPSYTPSRSSSSGSSSGGATYTPSSGSNGRSRGGN